MAGSKNYRDLDIYKEAQALFYETHEFSLQLPKYELYEIGSQLRRAAGSISANIVEGYGRKIYKSDFIKFLNYAYASTLETLNHLEKINHLYPEFSDQAVKLGTRYNSLGGKIFMFIKYVKSNWKT